MDTLSLEQNPLLKDVVLPWPEELKGKRVPTIGLHLLVKNGASCVGRLIDNVGPYIHEVGAVVNDTTDDTISILEAKCKEHKLVLNVFDVTAKSHPGFYLLDVPETYSVGAPLDGETYEGPFTNKPLLADWAAVRNLGWTLLGSEWRLFMDVDDVMLDPESLPGLCLALEERGVDMATGRYQFDVGSSKLVRSDGMRERLALNTSAIRWFGKVHETLTGHERVAHVEGNLLVVDRRDSTGADVRVPGRCFKVLYHEGRSRDWNVSPRTLIYLAMECQTSMPRLASAAIDRYLERSTWKEERAWACAMRGEICAARGDFKEASSWFELALTEHPGVRSAMRLCYSRFQEQKWQEAIDAYSRGLVNKNIVQALDNGPIFEDACKILVAAAHRKLGHYDEALRVGREALAIFPNNDSLKKLVVELESVAKKAKR